MSRKVKIFGDRKGRWPKVLKEMLPLYLELPNASHRHQNSDFFPQSFNPSVTHSSLLRYSTFKTLQIRSQKSVGCHWRFCFLWGTVYNDEEQRAEGT